VAWLNNFSLELDAAAETLDGIFPSSGAPGRGSSFQPQRVRATEPRKASQHPASNGRLNLKSSPSPPAPMSNPACSAHQFSSKHRFPAFTRRLLHQSLLQRINYAMPWIAS